MNLPKTIDQQSSPSERTDEYQSLVASPPPPVRSVRVALAEAYRYPSDVQQLLQKRLRFIGLVFASLFGVFTILNTVIALQDLERYRDQWWLYAINFFIFLTCTVVTAVLWTRRALPLNRLRMLETFLFLPVMMDFGFFLAYQLFARNGMKVPTGERDAILFFIASGESIFYFALIVSYSTFIPCTWRRCASMVGIFALTPLTVTLAASLTMNPSRETFCGTSSRWPSG
jgi:hypothetical protein